MRVEFRDAVQIDPRRGSRRRLSWSVVLAVLVIAAAGLTGTIHFGGPRWVPRIHVAPSRPVTSKPRSRQTPPEHKLRQHLGTIKFPFGTVILWTVVGLIAIGLAYLLWRWWAGRPTRAATERHTTAVAAVRQVPPSPEPEPDAPVLRTGLELALEVLDERRDPADAIVQAWLGLQQAAEDSGIVRTPAETPTEFTSRIMGRVVADDRPVKTLLRLYLRTRFGDHPVTDDEVADVRAALEELVTAWPAHQPAARTAGHPR